MDTSTADLRLGIDLGGTKIEIGAFDGAMRTLLRRRVPTPAGDYGAKLSAIAGLVRDAEVHAGRPGTVGIGTPGSISPQSGLIRNANSTVLIGKPFQRDLEAALARPVRMTNDANCLALSEALDGAAAGIDNVFAAILGTGVGGGLAIFGRIVEGTNAIAGEWGHNPLPWAGPDELPGPQCYCGRRGCIETFLCGPALSRQYAQLSGENIPPTEIARRAAHHDAQAAACMERYEHRLARAFASVINVVDPAVIVIGGGVCNIDRLYETIPRLLPDFVFSDSVRTRVVRAAHGDSSGVRGAALLWSTMSS
ncbi:MAG TPA: ROK family protein [Candidatus Baltobacteraceae bacterium]|jgi:fructokinase|nr:ROK family protein [Candidatus Baltobacteraceae bacterium]